MSDTMDPEIPAEVIPQVLNKGKGKMIEDPDASPVDPPRVLDKGKGKMITSGEDDDYGDGQRTPPTEVDASSFFGGEVGHVPSPAPTPPLLPTDGTPGEIPGPFGPLSLSDNAASSQTRKISSAAELESFFSTLRGPQDHLEPDLVVGSSSAASSSRQVPSHNSAKAKDGDVLGYSEEILGAIMSGARIGNTRVQYNEGSGLFEVVHSDTITNGSTEVPKELADAFLGEDALPQIIQAIGQGQAQRQIDEMEAKADPMESRDNVEAGPPPSSNPAPEPPSSDPSADQ